MATGLRERLAAGDILVADGALGTMLMARGLESGACPEQINLERPEVLTEISGAYLEAGADILQTNTFGGSPLKLARYGLEQQVVEINRAAVVAVRRAVGERALVSGSCGPTGKILKPYGDTDPEAVYDSYREQVQALIDAGIDLLCIETMTDLREATLAVRSARALSADLPIMATMTFEHTPRGFFTIMGTTVAQAVTGLRDAGADVVGSNCGNGSAIMTEVARAFRTETDHPMLIQANAGLPELVDGALVYAETPAQMAAEWAELLRLGVNIIGGCCGTTPEHIRALRDLVDRYRP